MTSDLRWRAQPSAIWLRQEFPVQRKRTLSFCGGVCMLLVMFKVATGRTKGRQQLANESPTRLLASGCALSVNYGINRSQGQPMRKSMNRRKLVVLGALAVGALGIGMPALFSPTTVRAAAEAGGVDAKVQATIDRGLAFLKAQQKPDGGWQKENDPPAITAIALK